MVEIANAWRDKYIAPASVLILPTSSMKKSVADKILETGSFSPLAEEITPELNRYLTYYIDQTGIVGRSFGSRVAANMLNILDNPEITKLVTINDAPS